MASTTVWPVRECFNGAEVPLSNRIRMSRGALWRHRRGRIQATRGEFYHGHHLFTRQVKPFHDLFDGCSNFEVVKDNGTRRARVLENPSAAALAGNAFHG